VAMRALTSRARLVRGEREISFFERGDFPARYLGSSIFRCVSFFLKTST
jgi:hypothetical protein